MTLKEWLEQKIRRFQLAKAMVKQYSADNVGSDAVMQKYEEQIQALIKELKSKENSALLGQPFDQSNAKHQALDKNYSDGNIRLSEMLRIFQAECKARINAAQAFDDRCTDYLSESKRGTLSNSDIERLGDLKQKASKALADYNDKAGKIENLLKSKYANSGENYDPKNPIQRIDIQPVEPKQSGAIDALLIATIDTHTQQLPSGDALPKTSEHFKTLFDQAFEVAFSLRDYSSEPAPEPTSVAAPVPAAEPAQAPEPAPEPAPASMQQTGTLGREEQKEQPIAIEIYKNELDIDQNEIRLKTQRDERGNHHGLFHDIELARQDRAKQNEVITRFDLNAIQRREVIQLAHGLYQLDASTQKEQHETQHIGMPGAEPPTFPELVINEGKDEFKEAKSKLQEYINAGVGGRAESKEAYLQALAKCNLAEQLELANEEVKLNQQKVDGASPADVPVDGVIVGKVVAEPPAQAQPAPTAQKVSGNLSPAEFSLEQVAEKHGQIKTLLARRETLLKDYYEELKAKPQSPSSYPPAINEIDQNLASLASTPWLSASIENAKSAQELAVCKSTEQSLDQNDGNKPARDVLKRVRESRLEPAERLAVQNYERVKDYSGDLLAHAQAVFGSDVPYKSMAALATERAALYREQALQDFHQNQMQQRALFLQQLTTDSGPDNEQFAGVRELAGQNFNQVWLAFAKANRELAQARQGVDETIASQLNNDQPVPKVSVEMGSDTYQEKFKVAEQHRLALMRQLQAAEARCEEQIQQNQDDQAYQEQVKAYKEKLKALAVRLADDLAEAEIADASAESGSSYERDVKGLLEARAHLFYEAASLGLSVEKDGLNEVFAQTPAQNDSELRAAYDETKFGDDELKAHLLVLKAEVEQLGKNLAIAKGEDACQTNDLSPPPPGQFHQPQFKETQESIKAQEAYQNARKKLWLVENELEVREALVNARRLLADLEGVSKKNPKLKLTIFDPAIRDFKQQVMDAKANRCLAPDFKANMKLVQEIAGKYEKLNELSEQYRGANRQFKRNFTLVAFAANGTEKNATSRFHINMQDSALGCLIETKSGSKRKLKDALRLHIEREMPGVVYKGFNTETRIHEFAHREQGKLKPLTSGEVAKLGELVENYLRSKGYTPAQGSENVAEAMRKMESENRQMHIAPAQ